MQSAAKNKSLAPSSPNEESLADVMHGLLLKQQEIASVIPQDKPVFYVDIPVHLNIGDLLINRGTDFFFLRYKYNVVARASEYDYRITLKSMPKDATIVMHGGGNLGDIWPHHELVRQDVLKRFTNHKIIVMPQTVHFKDPANLERFKGVYNRHPDLTLYLRDKVSQAFAHEHLTKHSYLMPDMAHQLWRDDPLLQIDKSGSGELFLGRTDCEADARRDTSLRTAMDWHHVTGPVARVEEIALRTAMRLNPWAQLQPGMVSMWYKLRDTLIARGAERLALYEYIFTDRLHAAILGLMLGKRVTVIDNNYGKLGNYFEAWMPGKIQLVRNATDGI